MNIDIDKDAFQSIGNITDKIVSGLGQERAYTGGKITAPGIWKDVPMSVYHSDCCDGPSVSSSVLRGIAPPDGCPMKAWDDFYLNPDRAEQEEKDHFSLGKAVHTLLLGESDFQKAYAVRPKQFDSWRTKDAKDWREATIKLGKTVLVPEMREQLEGMANRVANDRVFLDHLTGRVERTVVYQDKRTGLWVKARPDSIPADTVIADLKTTADASQRGCLNTIKKFNYHMQLALCGTALEEVTHQRVTDYVLLFIEPKRPWAYNIKPVDNQYIWLGARQNRAAMNIFAEGFKTGYWPTYFDSGITASPSDWFEKQIENEPSIPSEAT